ncbi:hypothetical protein [Haladaptatus sp. CMAA 1911]|uniref:hypothetical protein n=1 Tax=unclassified Haladaptatus TaxID=2622732 RepID=UPI00375516C0
MRGNRRPQTGEKDQRVLKASRLRTDGGESEDESAEREDSNTEESNVLYLDLKGLFLDLLGLEIDLDEVELSITAIPGPSRLLGNLLSALTKLLDKGPFERLKNVLQHFKPPSISDVLPGKSILPNIVYKVINKLLGTNFGVADEDEQSKETEEEVEDEDHGTEEIEDKKLSSDSIEEMSDEELQSFASEVVEQLEGRSNAEGQ